MKTMKKYLSFILSLILMFSLVSCSSTSENTTPTVAPQQIEANKTIAKEVPKQTEVTTSVNNGGKPLPTPVPKTTTPCQNNEQTVYTTNSGSKYHVDGCRYLSKSKIPINLSDAKSSGLTPCSKCHPPQ